MGHVSRIRKNFSRRDVLKGVAASAVAPRARALLPLGGSSVGIGTPAYFQNFDALTPGTSAPFNSFNFATVDNAQSYSSPNSAKSTVSNGGTNFGGSQALVVQPSVGDQVWFRIRTFFPTGFNFQASPHLKFMRIDTGPISGGTHSHLDWYISSGGLNTPGYLDWIYEGNTTQGPSNNGWLFGGSGTTPIATGINLNAWDTFEVSYVLGLTAGASRVLLWRNGLLLVDTANNIPSGVAQVSTLAGASYIAGAAAQASGGGGGYMWSTYWNGGAPQAQSAWCDDFTVYTSLTGAPTARDANGNRFIGVGPP